MFDSAAWFEHSKEVDAPGARVIRTVNQTVLVPAVLLLKGFDRIYCGILGSTVKFIGTRRLSLPILWEKSSNKELMDHGIPRDRGGGTLGECGYFLYSL